RAPHAGAAERACGAPRRRRSLVRDRAGQITRRALRERSRAGDDARRRDRRFARRQAAPPRRRADPAASVGASMTTRNTGSATMSNAADALRVEEVKRTRALLGFAPLAGLVVALAVLVAPGDPRLARALLALLAVGVAG